VYALLLQRYPALLDIPCMLVTQVHQRLMVIAVIITTDQDFPPQIKVLIVITWESML
jgi:hypothetical protein